MKRFSFLALVTTGFWLAAGVLPSPIAAQEKVAATAAVAPAAKDDRVITFCAYNVRNYLKMPRSVNGQLTEDAPKPDKEIAGLVGILGQIQPDILGICEIGTAADLADLQTRLRSAGMDLPHTAMAQGGDTARRLALLSRFPITSRQSQESLKYQIGDVILPMQRGILDVTIQVRPGYDIRFLGVHFKSQREVPGMDQKLMRRNEAHLLRLHVDSILSAAPDTRLMAYGDFNEGRNEPGIVEIQGVRGTPRALTDIRLHDSRGEKWTHFWAAADHYSRLDYCFVNRALQGDVQHAASYIADPANYYDASDHRPLVVRIDTGVDEAKGK